MFSLYRGVGDLEQITISNSSLATTRAQHRNGSDNAVHDVVVIVDGMPRGILRFVFFFAIDRFSEQLTRYAGSRTRLKVKDGSIDDASW